jgi:hypothetical protein
MKRKAALLIVLLTIAAVMPLIVIKVQATLSAGPDQDAYTGRMVAFNGTTTENVSAIIRVTWDFGDNSNPVNGSDPALLNTTHTYTAAGVYNATLTVKFDSTLNTTETANAIITVFENQPPVANAGLDQFVEQTTSEGTNVTLDGTASYDPDNDALTYNWNWTDGSATGVTHTVLFPPGKTTVTLTVSDGLLEATDTVNIIVQDLTAPLVETGPNVIAEQESHEGTKVTLNGTATDAVSTGFNFTWSENNVVLKPETNVTDTTLTYTFNLGEHIVTLNATDEAGNIGSANVTVTIIDTIPPIVDAGSDITVEQESYAGTQVTLNGTATDICSTRFNFTWSENDTVLVTETNVTDTTLTYIFSSGTHIVTLNATDMAGNTGAANVIVTVIDTTPPEINITATPSNLWPPNHKYAEVQINLTVYDNADPSPTIAFVSITSNEPDNGNGDGNTTNDIVVVNDFTFNLRAERSGTNSGRIYTITYSATDASGNYATASVTVQVPHNQ